MVIERAGKKYRTEFEYKASNFVDHGHDIRQCDLLICWQNDYGSCCLPVIELSAPGWENTELRQPTNAEKELEYWKQRALRYEKQVSGLRREIDTIEQRCESLERKNLTLLPFMTPIPRRPPTPQEAAVMVQLYADGSTMSLNELCRLIYGHKDGKAMAWVKEALSNNGQVKQEQ